MAYLLNFGNVLYLLAFSARDILWLRIITVVGTLCLIPYFYFRETPDYWPILWNTLFIVVNLVQIVLLFLERRPVFFGDEELRLYRTIFRTLKPREFAKLLAIADWKKVNVGDELLVQNKPVEALMLISSGRGTIEVDGRQVAEVASGQFVGEMGFLTEQDASARVRAAVPTDFLSWPSDKLRELLQESPELHVKVQGILGSDLVEKLRQEGISAAHPSRLMEAFRDAGAK